jgi:hypothetical protein
MVAPSHAVRRPPHAGATATAPVMPYDHPATFRLRGAPGNIVDGVINIGVDGTFVATAIGYGFEEDRARPLALPSIRQQATNTTEATFTIGDITIGDIASDALLNGFRVKPLSMIGSTVGDDTLASVSLDQVVAQQARNLVLEQLNAPTDISFFFSMVDTASGRELQDEPVHNLAALGKSNGERPFRLLPKPLSFAPRSSVRLQVIENTEGVQGTLFIVLFGYKVLSPSHCPEPVVRALTGTAQCPTESIGVPSANLLPYDYVANVELLGRPNRQVQQDVNINVEGGFVATAVGYALAGSDLDVRLGATLERLRNSTVPADQGLKSRIFLASGLLDLGAVPLSLFPVQALLDGIRIRSKLVRIGLDDGGRPTARLVLPFADRVFESINQPNDVSFRYTVLDSSTGRELQNGLINNIAGLGIANGDRPFKSFARPMIFLPRSAIRVVVQEHFGRGRLHLVFQGYKLGGYTHDRSRR